MAGLGFLDKEHTIAGPGFNRWLVPPAALAIRGLGRHTEIGSAIMIMAICGGAIMPQLFAVLKQHHDFQLVFLLLMAPAYCYILFFATIGHRVGRGSEA